VAMSVAAPASIWRWRFWVVVFLGLAVVMSALGVVYAKFQTRVLVDQLQDLRAEKEKMDIEWGLLQLEQGTQASEGLIDKAARTQLDMILPPADQVIIIRQ